jgi:putative ABC transport system permease protein
MLLLTVFATAALALAAIGTYGVMACVVSQGTRELGDQDCGRRDSARNPGAGRAAGIDADDRWCQHRSRRCPALTRLLRGMLFGVTGSDPLTYAAITGLLVIVSLAASARLAHRASRTDSMESLRRE